MIGLKKLIESEAIVWEPPDRERKSRKNPSINPRKIYKVLFSLNGYITRNKMYTIGLTYPKMFIWLKMIICTKTRNTKEAIFFKTSKFIALYFGWEN